MQLEPVKKETLTEQVMNQLAEKITSGELKPGERLPDERSLSAALGVTRSRIREALRALSLVGLVDIRPGGGSFVSEQSGKMPREAILWSYYRELANYDDLYAARRLVETAVYLSCYDNRTQQIVDQLVAYVDRLLDLDVINMSAEDFAAVIDEIDGYVGERCGNGIYTKLMQTMIILRHESSLRILNLPTSRQSATLWRVKILKAFTQDDRDLVETTLNGFFDNSIREISE